MKLHAERTYKSNKQNLAHVMLNLMMIQQITQEKLSVYQQERIHETQPWTFNHSNNKL